MPPSYKSQVASTEAVKESLSINLTSCSGTSRAISGRSPKPGLLMGMLSPGMDMEEPGNWKFGPSSRRVKPPLEPHLRPVTCKGLAVLGFGHLPPHIGMPDGVGCFAMPFPGTLPVRRRSNSSLQPRRKTERDTQARARREKTLWR